MDSKTEVLMSLGGQVDFDKISAFFGMGASESKGPCSCKRDDCTCRALRDKQKVVEDIFWKNPLGMAQPPPPPPRPSPSKSRESKDLGSSEKVERVWENLENEGCVSKVWKVPDELINILKMHEAGIFRMFDNLTKNCNQEESDEDDDESQEMAVAKGFTPDKNKSATVPNGSLEEPRDIDISPLKRSPEKRFYCITCIESFATRFEYNSHFSRHRNCKDCGKLLKPAKGWSLFQMGTETDGGNCEGCRERRRRVSALARGATETAVRPEGSTQRYQCSEDTGSETDCTDDESDLEEEEFMSSDENMEWEDSDIEEYLREEEENKEYMRMHGYLDEDEEMDYLEEEEDCFDEEMEEEEEWDSEEEDEEEELELAKTESKQRTVKQVVKLPPPPVRKQTPPSHKTKEVTKDLPEKSGKADQAKKSVTANKAILERYTCSTCNKGFQYRGRYQLHMEKVHKQKVALFACPKCSERFLSVQCLKEHEGTHKEPRLTFQCIVCDKIFLRKDHLSQHMITHSTEKKFACRACGKAFTALNSVTIHESKTISCRQKIKKMNDEGKMSK